MDEEKHHPVNVLADVTVAVVILLLALAFFGSYLSTVVGWYYAFLNWLYSTWAGISLVLEIILSIFSAVLFIFIVYILNRMAKIEKTPPEEEIEVHEVSPKEDVREAWEHIRKLANSHNPSDWNMAVLRADALLEEVLQRLGYEGETIADRLKIVGTDRLPSLDRLWSAHRLRNMIAHDPLEQHTKEAIIYGLRSYEQALKELGMMEEINSGIPEKEEPPPAELQNKTPNGNENTEA